MKLTTTEKALMMRAARQLASTAAELKRSTTVGGSWPSAKRSTKAYHDRLLRDERDLRDLAKRLEGSDFETGAGGGNEQEI